MYRSFHFVAIKIIRTSENDRGRCPRFRSLDQDQLIITNTFLNDLTSFAQGGSLKGLLTFEVGQRGHKGGTGGLGDPLEVDLFASADGHGAGLREVLQAEVVDAPGGEDDVGPGVEDLLDAFFGDVGFTITDGLQFLGVGDKNLWIKKGIF